MNMTVTSSSSRVKSCAFALILAGLLAACAGESDNEPPAMAPPPPPPPAPAVEPAATPEPYTQAAPPPPGAATASPAAPPPPAATSAPPAPQAIGGQLVYSYPTGQWVYTVDHEWIWVPSGSAPVAVDGVPYVMLYTPSFGWTWYVSPWGWGPYFYGPWIHHPWHPVGWHGYWVAHPSVIHRLGGPRGHFRR